jgi:hypothetical protein
MLDSVIADLRHVPPDSMLELSDRMEQGMTNDLARAVSRMAAVRQELLASETL